MDPISHKKAQEYLHLQREGLETVHRQALEAHLFVCQDCREYGRNLERLERDLSENFRTLIDPVPTPVGMPGKVRDHLDRANRNRQVINFAGSLAGGLVLLILMVALIESFSGSRLPVASPSTEDAPSPIPGGQLIAFISRRDGNDEIYTMNADGSAQTNLTHHPAADYLPTWSPDGQQLAFVSDRSGKPDVYLMYYDGSVLTKLTDLPYAEGFASLSWSPDGTHLAAEVLRSDPKTGELNERVFLIHSDASSAQDIAGIEAYDTTGNKLPIRAYDPQWSPTGNIIAFRFASVAPVSLNLIQLDTRMDVLKIFPLLTRDIRHTPAFAWSPDGFRLAYFTTPWPLDEVPPEYFDICRDCQFYDDEPDDLRLSSLEGSRTQTLYLFENLSLDFYGLSWSPDGDQLAFTANKEGEEIRHIYLLSIDGKKLVDVAGFGHGNREKSIPSWSPDSTRLVIDAGQEGTQDIYAIDLAARLREGIGSGVTNLTIDSPGVDYQPQWQP